MTAAFPSRCDLLQMEKCRRLGDPRADPVAVEIILWRPSVLWFAREHVRRTVGCLHTRHFTGSCLFIGCESCVIINFVQVGPQSKMRRSRCENCTRAVVRHQRSVHVRSETLFLCRSAQWLPNHAATRTVGESGSNELPRLCAGRHEEAVHEDRSAAPAAVGAGQRQVVARRPGKEVSNNNKDCIKITI